MEPASQAAAATTMDEGQALLDSMDSPCYTLSKKNDVRVVGGKTVEFVIKPTMEGTEDLEPTRVHFTAPYWLKLKEQMPTITKQLKARCVARVKVYNNKYVQVKEDFGYWWANLVSYSRRGDIITASSVWLKEFEWDNLVLAESDITSYMRGVVAVQQRKKMQQQMRPTSKQGLLYKWQCGDIHSQEYFFGEEDAEKNAKGNPQVAANIKSLKITSVQSALPDVAKFVRYAYIFCLRHLAEDKWEEDKENITRDDAYNSVAVPSDWVSALYSQFYLTAGVVPPREGCDVMLDSLLCFVPKDCLIKEAQQLPQDNSAYHLLCQGVVTTYLTTV